MSKVHKILPPTDPMPEEVTLLREPFNKLVTLRMPWGDSYRLEPSTVRRYLMVCGMPELKADRAVDWLWNYNAVHVDLMTQVFSHLPYHATQEAFPDEKPPVYAPQVG